MRKLLGLRAEHKQQRKHGQYFGGDAWGLLSGE